MAEVMPFKGIRYNKDFFASMRELVTPPYDVIDSKAQDNYYQRHPYNFIRLDLAKHYDQDTGTNNRYTRSAADFARWYREGILKRDQNPAFYIYQQRFELGGQIKTRTGFMGAVKLEDYDQGTILPHEETLSKAKLDRLQLLHACEANFSPIFGLYHDPEHTVTSALLEATNGTDPEISLEDDHGVRHLLWVNTHQLLHELIRESLRDQKIFIADGHHRYETALHFYREKQAQGFNGYEHTLMTLVSLQDTGLVILPTYRLLRNLYSSSVENILEKIAVDFQVETITLTDPVNEIETTLDTHLFQLKNKIPSAHVFGLYKGGNQFYVLTLKGNISPDANSSKSTAWRNLDVSILQTLILNKLLGIGSEERKKGEKVTYTRDAIEAITEIQNGSHQMAFFLNPPQIQEVIDVATAGDKMPQKSTYFYPKLITGLVINPLSYKQL